MRITTLRQTIKTPVINQICKIMHHTLKYIVLFFSGLLLFSACEKNKVPMFNKKDSFIQLDKKEYTIKENSRSELFISSLLASYPASEQIEVLFEVSSDEFGENGAIEGVDYRIIYPVSKKLNIVEGRNRATVTIKCIDNNELTEDKFFTIKLISNSLNLPMDIDGRNMAKIRISDDEHPLDAVFGNYLQTDFLFSDTTVQNSYQITLSPVSGSIDKVSIHNFWNQANDDQFDIIASVDLENNTLEILPNQLIYIDETYGNTRAVHFDTTTETYNTEASIEGTIDSIGNVTLGAWGALVEDGEFNKFIKSTWKKK